MLLHHGLGGHGFDYDAELFEAWKVPSFLAFAVAPSFYRQAKIIDVRHMNFRFEAWLPREPSEELPQDSQSCLTSTVAAAPVEPKREFVEVGL